MPTIDDHWEIVPARPTPVLCLRHTGCGAGWLDTWRRLTALLFECGLAGPRTRAVGVVYDLHDRRPADAVRYDACLSVDHGSLDDGTVWRGLNRVSGLRYEVIMSEGPLARAAGGHARRLADMAVTGAVVTGTAAVGTASGRPRRGPGAAPLYEVYPCSPVFLAGEVPVVEWFRTVRSATDPASATAPGVRGPAGQQSPGGAASPRNRRRSTLPVGV
ncbi:hypothetical protein [Streptomyces bohaiensis]|uniref:Uncharacterized protein n=1 Tax=Streptomyces bohaiensis TaxID=1431344 RepID=A0ABX1CA60_9ACTN|nr:hypothetical protein [Streptomyces bohaiensis]NJQ16020.1 hypothetical protein [Streptomyces bohaiensis]